MKINEVTVKEASLGQLGAGLTGIGQGIAGAWRSGEKFAPIQGFKAGWQTKGAAQSQNKQVKDITTQVLQKWAAYNQNIKTKSGKFSEYCFYYPGRFKICTFIQSILCILSQGKWNGFERDISISAVLINCSQ